MASFALNAYGANPYQGLNYVQISQAQNAAQQAANVVVAQQVTASGIRQASNQTNVAISQSGQSNGSAASRGREASSRTNDTELTRAEGEFSADAAARGGRRSGRPGAQLNILV